MRRAAPIVLLALAAVAQPHPASADAIPDGVRFLDYSFSVSNLGEYPDHVFILYPTKNGYGCLLEEGVEPGELMMRQRRETGPTRLYAMRRQEFDRAALAPERVSAEDGASAVTRVNAPPGAPRSVMASAAIEPPDWVPWSNAAGALARTYRIARLTDRELELELVGEVTQPYTGPPMRTMEDAMRDVVDAINAANAQRQAAAEHPAPTPPPAPIVPGASGPAGTAGCGCMPLDATPVPLLGLLAGVSLTAVAIRRRRR